MVMVRGDWLTGIPYLGLLLASIFRQDQGALERHFPFLIRLPASRLDDTTPEVGGQAVTPEQAFYGPLSTLARGIQESYYGRMDGRPVSYIPGYEEDDAVAFASLRQVFGVSERDYVDSLTKSSFYSFQTNSKSNQYFCFTGDGRYIIKTMSSEEISALGDILLDYHRHMEHYPKSLLVQYCGHYRVGAYHFLVMRNLLHTPPSTSFMERYDVKGSTVGRSCDDEDFLKPGKVMKDLELVRRPSGLEFGLVKPAFLHQVMADVAFLETHNLMDYSLLIGVKPAPNPALVWSNSLFKGLIKLILGPPPRPPPPDPGWAVTSADGKEVYVVGIIDILQLYNTRKRAEVAFKSMVYDYKGVSAAPPTFYANRFLWFLARVVRGWGGEHEHTILNWPSWFQTWPTWAAPSSVVKEDTKQSTGGINTYRSSWGWSSSSNVVGDNDEMPSAA